MYGSCFRICKNCGDDYHDLCQNKKCMCTIPYDYKWVKGEGMVHK